MRVEKVSRAAGLTIRTVVVAGDSYEERERARKRLLDLHRRLTDPAYVERKRESVRRWRARNPQKGIKYQRRWRKANPELAKLQAARYMEKHRERRLAYFREYRKKRKNDQRA